MADEYHEVPYWIRITPWSGLPRWLAVFVENIRQPTAGFHPGLVMVQAEADGVNAGVLFQHPQHGVFADSAESNKAAFLPPASGVTCEEGQQVDGSHKDIEPVAEAGVVEAAAGTAALYVDTESPADIVDAALVNMTGNAIFVLSNKDCVVIFPAFELFATLIEQTSMDKSIDSIPIQKAAFQQIGIHPPHILVGGRQGKLLFGVAPAAWWRHRWFPVRRPTDVWQPPDS